jgi:CelD/BcsL family acetyltransferase involved in cellulose biosynthesis
MVALAPAWQALADRALEANPFYEPSFLLPLIRYTGPYRNLRFWLVSSPDEPEQLLGMFPFDERRRGPMLLVSPFTRGRSSGQPIDIDLGTPLIDRARAAEVMDAVFNHLDRCWLIGLDWFALSGDGAFLAVLRARIAARAQPWIDMGGWSRPYFVPREDGSHYLAATMGKGRRQTMQRYRRHLEREGSVTFEVLGPDEDPTPWIDSYFTLEASGWKGRQGTDIGVSEGSRKFFAEVMQARHERGGIFVYRLALSGQAVAQTWIFRPSDGTVGLLWKTSFDDRYAKQSPGMQVEIEAVHALHDARCGLAAVDSCAHRNHAMWSWLWQDRRELVCLLVLPRRALHRLIIPIVVRLRRWRQACRVRWPVKPEASE